MMNWLVTKVNAIKVLSTNGLVSKTQYSSDKQNLEKIVRGVNKKMVYASGLVKKTDLNNKITEIENQITSITCLVTIATLNPKIIPYR